VRIWKGGGKREGVWEFVRLWVGLSYLRQRVERDISMLEKPVRLLLIRMMIPLMLMMMMILGFDVSSLVAGWESERGGQVNIMLIILIWVT
jgi:hypothetical protein